MKTLNITKQYTFAKFINSTEAKELAANFGMEHVADNINKRYTKYNPQVFIVEEPNYGLNFKAYIRYNADGINWFKEFHYTGSTLCNSGIRTVNCMAFHLDINNENAVKPLEAAGIDVREITFGSEWYENCESNRAIFRKRDFETYTAI